MGSWLLLFAALLPDTTGHSAVVSGTVRDAETDAPIAGVLLALTALGRTTTTDSLGYYRLEQIPAGTHELSARRIGYASWSVELLVPSQGALNLDFALRPAAVPVPELQVRAAGFSTLGATSLTRGDSISPFPARALTSAALWNHPLLAEPDYFAGLAGGDVVVAPESPDGIHLAGGSTDQIAFLLDGIPVFNPMHAGGTFGAWNPDIVSGAALTTSPSSGTSDALGATLAGEIPAPSSSPGLSGALTATQGRVAMAIPIGRAGGGISLALRSGFQGLVGHGSDLAFLGGRNHDWTAKLEQPLAGGAFFLLGFGSDNASAPATAAALLDRTAPPTQRHRFSWRSGSYGGGWTGALGNRLLQLRAWSAGTEVGSRWIDSSPSWRLRSHRQDFGLSAWVRSVGPRSATAVGLEAATSATEYRLRSTPALAGVMRPEHRLSRLAATGHRRQALGEQIAVEVGLTGTWSGDGSRLAPAASLWWRPATPLTLSASYSRRHQYSQSLRNAESVVGAIFPVDLSVASGGSVPVAQADLAVVAAEFRPAPRLRIGARAYARAARGLALVAMRETGPFATGPVTSGTSTTRGAVLELEANRQDLALRFMYGYQDTWVQGGGIRYRPAAAVSHLVDAGLTAHPGSGWSLRLGLSGQFGRHATAIAGPFEWESCNLRDGGCEFAGTPALAGPLGGVSLPAYTRLDVGIRHEWHTPVFRRDGVIALFGTVTNLFGRKNTLTLAVDPITGARSPVEMRPRAPLVVGLDWRF